MKFTVIFCVGSQPYDDASSLVAFSLSCDAVGASSNSPERSIGIATVRPLGSTFPESIIHSGRVVVTPTLSPVVSS